MPVAIDDPAGPATHQVSGQLPSPDSCNPALPPDITPRQVTLRDRQTVATIVPFASRQQIPASLILYLCVQINKEIEGGDTYPYTDAFTPADFADFFFHDFGAVMLLGHIESADDVVDGKDWERECLGSFYIKPNYPGRSSHVCNGGLLVTDASRNRGAGRLMGETYIEWAPRLGYSYSVFNLVYETNVASCRIWDSLGFKRIGRIPGCGRLRSYPDRLIDAIMYGRDLTPGEGEEPVSEERFDKIKFYLKYGKYPSGADRAEKSRLRSAATHYKLLDGDKLMLKDKEVISDPSCQWDIARGVHAIHHGGINKTTATIAEKYHWSRIKETVSDVIRACVECKDLGKTPNPGGGARRAVSTPSSAMTPTLTNTTTTTTTATATATATTMADTDLGQTASLLHEQPPFFLAPDAAAAPATPMTTMATTATPTMRAATTAASPALAPVTHVSAASRILALQAHDSMLADLSSNNSHPPSPDAFANPNDIVMPMSSSHALHTTQPDHNTLHAFPPHLQSHFHPNHQHQHQHQSSSHPLPLPPPLSLPPHHHNGHHQQHHLSHGSPVLQQPQLHHMHHLNNPMLQDQPDHDPGVYQPIDPQMINNVHQPLHNPHSTHLHHSNLHHHDLYNNVHNDGLHHNGFHSSLHNNLHDDIHQNDLRQNGLHQNGLHQNGLHQNGLHQNGLHQNGLHQNGLHQNGLHQNGLHQNGLHQNGLHQNGLHQNGLHNDHHLNHPHSLSHQHTSHRHHQAAPSSSHDISFDHYHAHADFQALLNATDDGPLSHDNDAAMSSMDREMDMLIEHDAVVDGEEVDQDHGHENNNNNSSSSNNINVNNHNNDNNDNDNNSLYNASNTTNNHLNNDTNNTNTNNNNFNMNNNNIHNININIREDIDLRSPSPGDGLEEDLGDTHRDRRAAHRDRVLYDVGFG